jgi:meiotic recombination protein DMC1
MVSSGLWPLLFLSYPLFSNRWRTGKTQLCHTMCITSQNSENGGLVAVLDTEGTFRPARLKPIAERFGLDPETVLENVVSARVYTSEQLPEVLTQLCALMIERPFRLIIVDSVTALFRADFVGRGELAERQQRLGQLMSKLRKIADEFNTAVVVTNQVYLLGSNEKMKLAPVSLVYLTH